MKHHNKIDYEYKQDIINGITENEYSALFNFLKGTKKNKIIDLCGGTGELSLKLQDLSYDVLLCDLDDNLLNIASEKGVKKIKKINLLKDILPKTDIIVMKSAQHEFKHKYLKSIHSKIFNSLNKNGIYLDWDVHVENDIQANFLLKIVNIKDKLANDIHLVENRKIYFIHEIEESLNKIGFKKIEIIHKFVYTISIQKFANVYFKDNSGNVIEDKKIEFFEKTKKLILENGVPKGIGYSVKESENNIEFKFPAVIIKAEK